jgi:hypothetical protein
METKLETRTCLEEGTDRRITDGLRILARIIARAYLDSNGQVGKKEEIPDGGPHGIQRTD